jgi:transposase
MMNDMLTAENALLKNRISELEALVKYYEEQFRLTKHRQFGAKSEKSEYLDGQLTLFNEAEATADDRVAEPELAEVKKHFRRRKHTVGDNLPADLPVEIVEYALAEHEQICGECGGGLHVMGRESRRELKIIPAQVKVIEHICKVYSCRNCESTNDHTPIVKAPMPEAVIKGSFASAEAVAYIMTQKYVMGVPLYRQEQEWNRRGIMLNRQTMSNWLLRCAEDWLMPLYERLRVKLLEHRLDIHKRKTIFLRSTKKPACDGWFLKFKNWEIKIS